VNIVIYVLDTNYIFKVEILIFYMDKKDYSSPKSLPDVVFDEQFKILGLRSLTDTDSVTIDYGRDGEPGSSRSAGAGTSTGITYRVEPLNPDIPVNELYFDAGCGFRSGETVSAKIFKVRPGYWADLNDFRESYHFNFFDREWRKEEAVLELRSLDGEESFVGPSGIKYLRALRQHQEWFNENKEWLSKQEKECFKK
jgi:hypothetical protein